MKCADGVELSEEAVTTAITSADAKFGVAAFTMMTPETDPEADTEADPEAE
ncbi:MAG: hypothetical protein AAGA29_00820 [Planctomycetota bacterium]